MTEAAAMSVFDLIAAVRGHLQREDSPRLGGRYYKCRLAPTRARMLRDAAQQLNSTPYAARFKGDVPDDIDQHLACDERFVMFLHGDTIVVEVVP